MVQVELKPGLNFLSELYVDDCPDARLLAEYPSSNSDQTRFQNNTQFIIHDPFPPPRRELLKFLGPHHLMCGWGRHLNVVSEIAPPAWLLEHWERIFKSEGVPIWNSVDDSLGSGSSFVTLFPHQSLEANRQVVDPAVNYEIHSKEVIEKIECDQADVYESIKMPCIVKLSHGYAGLGNYFISSLSDESKMRDELNLHWPDATLVINSVIENIVDDFGVQFYLRKDGTMVWLGLTEQNFDENKKWCGGTFSQHQQTDLFEDLSKMIIPTGQHLHSRGYFGLVGIDILRDSAKDLFLVDVNPRLTGISPFLMASRIFARDDGLTEGVYQASRTFSGSCVELVEKAESISDARVVVLSGFEDSTEEGGIKTVCHISVSSNSQENNQSVLQHLFS